MEVSAQSPHSQGAQAIPQLLNEGHSLWPQWGIYHQPDDTLAHTLVHRAKVRNDWEMPLELDKQTQTVSELEKGTMSHARPTVSRGFDGTKHLLVGSQQMIMGWRNLAPFLSFQVEAWKSGIQDTLWHLAVSQFP